MPDSKPMRVLALCDSLAVRPGTAPTGFARVARNLFTHWQAAGVEVDIWGVGYEGWGYRDIPWQIFPAGNRDWNTAPRLNSFLQVLATGRYTHVWMLMDADVLCVGQGERSFPRQLRACCKKHGIKSVLYFPIDCDHQEFDCMEMVKTVDVAVTFTEYGARVVRNTLAQKLFPLHVLPHGLDEHFRPAAPDQRLQERRKIILENGKPFAGDGDFLMLNVNKNEWRKDVLRSLEIVKGLVDRGVPAKMILRMSAVGGTGISIHQAAAQLGLVDGQHYVLLDPVPEAFLPKLYHACDIYVTTTAGEGWGLGITEALGCGLPVAMPMHSSCGEIGEKILQQGSPYSNQIVWLKSENGFICGHDTRLRPRVELASAVKDLEDFWHVRHGASGDPAKPFQLTPETLEWLSWKRIAGEFLKLMK
jgi:glycosyltransferase involved in cell wall biosynthesis